MHVLVTGGTGFVGRHLVDVLLARGDRVTVLLRTPAKARGLAERGVILSPGTLDDGASLERACAGQEAIYHLAGLVAARSEREFMAVNRDGTASLLRAAAATGAPRFVYVSTLAAAGPSVRGSRHRDASVGAPLTAYGRSKLAGEAAVRAAALPWTIIRPPAVYGPHDTEFLTVFKAARLGVVPIFGDGRQELSLIYGPDLALALARTGGSAPTIGASFYASHPELVTSAQLVRTIAGAVGRTARIVPLPRWLAEGVFRVTSTAARVRGKATLLTPDKAREFFAEAWTCEPDQLTSATAWRATHDLAAGARATADWYRGAGWL